MCSIIHFACLLDQIRSVDGTITPPRTYKIRMRSMTKWVECLLLVSYLNESSRVLALGEIPSSTSLSIEVPNRVSERFSDFLSDFN